MNNTVLYPYTCPKCNLVKNYKRKRDYDNAVSKQSHCQECKRIEYQEKMERGFHEWVRKRQNEHIPNKRACEVMDYYNRNGYHFQHGLNGGEYFIDVSYVDSFGKSHRGIFLDGYDPVNKIVFEWDEPSHNSMEVLVCDFDRQNVILQWFRDPELKFVRYDESNSEMYVVARENCYNVQMQVALATFLSELKKWYSNTIDKTRDTSILMKLNTGIEELKKVVNPKRKTL